MKRPGLRVQSGPRLLLTPYLWRRFLPASLRVVRRRSGGCHSFESKGVTEGATLVTRLLLGESPLVLLESLWGLHLARACPKILERFRTLLAFGRGHDHRHGAVDVVIGRWLAVFLGPLFVSNTARQPSYELLERPQIALQSLEVVHQLDPVLPRKPLHPFDIGGELHEEVGGSPVLSFQRFQSSVHQLVESRHRRESFSGAWEEHNCLGYCQLVHVASWTGLDRG